MKDPLKSKEKIRPLALTQMKQWFFRDDRKG